MFSQIGRVQRLKFSKKCLYLGVLSLFFVLVSTNFVWAIWIDADGWGQESIDISNSLGDSDEPSVYLDSSSNPYIVWEDTSSGNYDIYLLKWNGSEWVDADGSSGQEAKNISNNAGTSRNASFCLDGSGNPHVAWHDHDYVSGKNQIYYLKWNGTAWVDADGSGQESINISNTIGSSFYPSLRLDSSGNPHIAWKDYISDNNYDIYYLQWNETLKEWVDADGSGRESINVSTNTTYSGRPSLSVDTSGNPHIAWMDSGSGRDIYYLQWNETLKEWVDAYGSSGREAINVSNTVGDSRYPSLCLDSSGNPHIAWDDSTPVNLDIYYLKWNETLKEWVDADGSSGREAINVSNNSGDSGHPSLSLDSSDNPHIAWFDRTPGSPDIYYLKRKGTAWVDVDGSGQESINVSDTTGESRVPSLYLDSSGNPHIAWRNNTSGKYDIYYLKWNLAPTLSWTGETNYTADGLNPEAGYPNTDFVFRVKYTDQDNHPPASGYPELHIKKDGTPISGSPFAMTPVDAGDKNYRDGKLYTYTKSRLEAGTDYTYYFEAKDRWNTPASGDPTNPVDAPDITNHIPTLSWTGETNYASDGLDPEAGPRETSFVYRVKYMDEDNDPPASGYPELHIEKDGTPISGSPFPMSAVNPGDNDYTDGKLYTYTKIGLEPGTDYTYYFEANDVWNSVATGEPTNTVDGPEVTNLAPTLSWTGEVNYTTDGLDPETGPRETVFVYRVKYTDEDNDPPASGYPKLHIRKGGLEIGGSPFAMSEVDAGDMNYSDGKLYTYTKSGLTPGEDYTYYFEAKDLWNIPATGEPTSATDAPDVTNLAPTLSWTGEANYGADGLDPESGYPNTNFVYRVEYTDQNNDAPAPGYPRLHIKKGGEEIAGSPFAMNEVDAGDTNYSDGKFYTYTKTRLGPGEDYTYYFEAKDLWNSPATGDPTNPVDAPDITNHIPILSWTEETNYTDDGLNPETGSHYTNFTYRVKYADQDNDEPASGYPKLHIERGGKEIDGSPFVMHEVDAGNKNYRDEDDKFYTYTKGRLPMGTDYTYYFEAKDLWDSVATGDPISAVDAPDVLIGFSTTGEVKIQGGENGYVNPLKGEVAKIHFWPTGAGTVNVEIFDLIGLLVWEKSKDVSGVQDSIEWNCRNDENDVVASGIYVVYVKGPGIKATKKVAVMK